MQAVEGFKAGDWVEVRSEAEILATLDADGCLDALPFMPEMLQYCGKTFRVFKSAHKTCDTINDYTIRRMSGAVHLEGLRCDGTAHGGCQSGCLLFFKEAWLKRVPGPPTTSTAPPPISACDVDALHRATRVPATAEAEPQYRCQATELVRATAKGSWWDPRLYVKDLTSRNISLRQLIGYGLIAAYNVVMRLKSLRGRGRPYPTVRGRAGATTPTEVLDLQPGEWVEVKSKTEIERTLNARRRNRGLWFDVEMVPYCGGKFRVLRRIEQFIDDRTGRMVSLRGKSCLVLDGVTCNGCLSDNRLFCPRGVYPFWHEVWLKRTAPPAADERHG